MRMNSPLGQYAPLVATISALLLIGAYVVALLFRVPLGVEDNALSQLQSVALVAVGAVFGSAVSVNGWKQPLQSAHQRTDVLKSQVDALASTFAVANPTIAPAVAEIVNTPSHGDAS